MALSKTGWSDKYVSDWMAKNEFPDIWGSRGMWKHYLYRFWSYYLTGDYTKENLMSSVVGTVVLMTPDIGGDNAIRPLIKLTVVKEKSSPTCFDLGEVDQNELGELIYSKKIPSKVQVLEEKRKNVYLAKHYHKRYNIMKELENAKKNFKEITGSAYSKFSSYVNERLKSFPTTTTYDKEDIKFLRISCALAMMSMRALVKSKDVLISMFFKTKLETCLQNILDINSPLSIAPPCKLYIDKIEAGLSKGAPGVESVFIPLVKCFVEWRTIGDVEARKRLAILGYTCMVATSLNGLIMVKMTLQVLNILNISWDQLVDYIFFAHTQTTVMLLSTFLRENFLTDEYQHSSLWCRIIDDNYYSDLTPEKHGFLAITFGKIIECATRNKGIWDSIWYKKLVRKIKHAKTLGVALFEELVPEVNMQSGTSTANALIRRHADKFKLNRFTGFPTRGDDNDDAVNISDFDKDSKDSIRYEKLVKHAKTLGVALFEEFVSEVNMLTGTSTANDLIRRHADKFKLNPFTGDDNDDAVNISDFDKD